MNNELILNLTQEFSSQIHRLNTIERWFTSGVINSEKAQLFQSIEGKLTVTGGFLHTLVEQESSLLFTRFPEYEIETTDEQLKKELEDLIENNKIHLRKELNRAIRDFVIYGAGLVKFNVSNNTLTFNRVNPTKAQFDLENNSFVAFKGTILGKIAERLNQNKDIVQINTNNGVRYYAGRDKIIKNQLSYSHTFSAIFNTYDNKQIVSNLLKVEKLLEAHEALSGRILNLMMVSTRVKAIWDKRYNTMWQDLLSGESIDVIAGQIPADSNTEPVKYLDNSGPINALNVATLQLKEIEEQIYKILGLTEIFSGKEVTNPNETVVNAINRTEKANILWEAKQNKINFFIKDVLENYSKNYLALIGANSEVSLNINTDAIGLLQAEQNEIKNQQNIDTVIGILDKATGLMQAGQTSYIAFLNDLTVSVLQKSNLSSSLADKVSLVFQDLASQSVALKEQQITPEMAIMQEQTSTLNNNKVAASNLDLEKKALHNEKLKRDLNTTDEEEELKQAQVENLQTKNATSQMWLKEMFNRIFHKQ